MNGYKLLWVQNDSVKHAIRGRNTRRFDPIRLEHFMTRTDAGFYPIFGGSNNRSSDTACTIAAPRAPF